MQVFRKAYRPPWNRSLISCMLTTYFDSVTDNLPPSCGMPIPRVCILTLCEAPHQLEDVLAVLKTTPDFECGVAWRAAIYG